MNREQRMMMQQDEGYHQPRRTRSVFGGAISSLTLLSVLLLGIAVIAYVTRFYIAASVIATITGMLWAILIGMLIYAWAKQDTVKTMQTALDMFIEVQRTNDDYDLRKTEAIAGAMTKAVNAAKPPVAGQVSTSGRPALPSGGPAMPLPSQLSGWAPPLRSMQTINMQFDQADQNNVILNPEDEDYHDQI